MKKLSKAILLALGALLVLAVFALFCVNLYIQSPRTQAQIQEQLSHNLRMPLKITNTSISPWSGLRITGITIPSGETNFLEAGSFVANYRAWPLLGGRLSVPEMKVDHPKIVWRQNAEGRWKLPTLETAAPVQEEPKAPNTAAATKPAKGGFGVEVGRFLVQDGSVDLLDKDGAHTAVLTGVNLTYTTLTEQLVEGTAEIERVVWADSLVLENVRTPFKYTAGEFTLADLTATLGGGTVHGSFHTQPDAPKSPFETSLTFDGVNVEHALISTSGKPPDITGIAQGGLDLHGDLHRAERAEGTGHFQLLNGRFQLDLFKVLGQFIHELTDLRLKDAKSEFHVAGEKVFVDQLTLSAADLQLSAKGQIRFDKKVALEAQLGVEESALKDLPDFVRSSFTPADNGRRTIDFNISGSTDKLRTDLPDKIMGQKIGQQFGDFLSGLFGGKKDDDKKKKEEEDKKKADKADKKKKKEQTDAMKAPAKSTPGPATPAPSPSPAAAPTTAITPAQQP